MSYPVVRTFFGVILMRIVAAGVKNNWGSIRHDCMPPKSNITAMSLLSIPECSSDNRTYSVESRDAQIIRVKTIREVLVRTCLISVKLSSRYCGALNRKFSADHPTMTYIHYLGSSQCLELHKTGTFTLYGKQVVGARRNESTWSGVYVSGVGGLSGECSNGGLFVYPDGSSVDNEAVYADVTVTLREARSSVLINDDKMIIGGTPFDCEYTDGYCKDTSEGEMVWSTNGSGCLDDIELLYQGKVKMITFHNKGQQSRIVMVESDNLIFSLQLGNLEQLCSVVVIGTEHRGIRISLKPNIGLYAFGDGDMITKYADMRADVDTKFLYATPQPAKWNKDIYDGIMDDMCSVITRLLEHRLVLAQRQVKTIECWLQLQQARVMLRRGKTSLIQLVYEPHTKKLKEK